MGRGRSLTAPCADRLLTGAGARAAGSPSASLLLVVRRRRKSRRVPPSGPRLRRPGKEGPRRAAVYLLPFGPGRAASGGFRFDLLSQRKRPALHGRPPAGFFPSLPSPAASGPEGGTRRLFRALRWVEGRATLAILGLSPSD